ncbi:MAG TPA: hypothetical protein H9783_02895 [Candidatus Limosilactobacillus faecipullorum]|nr:hypothetical protein [Candidatus Limosilactobacillus faecipullorum]
MIPWYHPVSYGYPYLLANTAADRDSLLGWSVIRSYALRWFSAPPTLLARERNSYLTPRNH